MDLKSEARPPRRTTDECGDHMGELLVSSGFAHALWRHGAVGNRTRRGHALAELLFGTEQHLYQALNRNWCRLQTQWERSKAKSSRVRRSRGESIRTSSALEIF